MLKNFSIMVFLCLLAGPAHAAGAPLKVVATQALFADIVREVGGDHVEVKAIASPKFNVHFIEPKPSDVRHVSKADLYVNAGLDLEVWSDPLLEAAGKPALFRGAERNLDLSQGVTLLNVPTHALSRAQGDIHLYGNPHFHMDPQNAKIMARHVADRLKMIDPANAATYEQNAQALLARLDSKIAEWKNACTACAGKEILSYHDDIEYLARFMGLHVHMFIEPKPGIPPAAKHLALVESDAKSHGIRLIVQPSYYPQDTSKHVADKINGKIVLVAQNAGELPGTETLFGFYEHNVRVISAAMQDVLE